jgi:hypothetical protein
MNITNENLLRGCIQEAQCASVSLTQAIAGIETCAWPQSRKEVQVLRLLRANSEAISLLLQSIDLTRDEGEPTCLMT